MNWKDIIEETYDRYHKRAYRILRASGFLDENEIGKRCFMPPTTVRSIINTLFQDGIIDIQEVPNKSGNMIILYNVNLTKIKHFYVSKMERSLLNILLRLEDMSKKLSDKLLAWTKDQESKYQEAIDKLQLVATNLDYSLMIFNDFS